MRVINFIDSMRVSEVYGVLIYPNVTYLGSLEKINAMKRKKE
jgi:hypothetical protein